MTINVNWPRGAEHTKVTSVQRMRTKVRNIAGVLRDNDRIVYIGMPGNAARAAGITDDLVGPFGKPWACLSDPRGWRYAYAEYLKHRINSNPEFSNAVRNLHGCVLVCWCKGSKRGADPDCHGDLLAFFAERLFHGTD